MINYLFFKELFFLLDDQIIFIKYYKCIVNFLRRQISKLNPIYKSKQIFL